MKYSLFVCLIVVAAASAVAQQPAMTKGISVQLAPTSNAVASPTADDSNAWIVAVTADGRLFFGVKPVTEQSLPQEMRATPRSREAKLYIKADARAPFSAVKQALHAAHENLFETAVLLTEQPQHAAGEEIVSPVGLEVRLGLPSAKASVVQLHSSGSPVPALKVNDQGTSWSNLENALQRVQERKLVVVEADGDLPFAEVVKAVDLSRSLGASVAISLMSL